MGALEAHRQWTVHVCSRHGHGRASGFHTRRHIARLARGLADILSNRRAREHWLLPGRLGTVHVWFNANRTLHECGCACAGAWVKACAVGACGWGASFVRSTAVRYRTVTSDVNAAFFARWVPTLGVIWVWQPHSFRDERRVRGCLETMAVRRARRVFARAGRPRDVACRGRPAERCGVLSCVLDNLEALEEGVVARTVRSWRRAIAVW